MASDAFMPDGRDAGRMVQFVFCILGIYGCFLTWGVLQERITTLDYRLQPHYYHHHAPEDGLLGRMGLAASGCLHSGARRVLGLFGVVLDDSGNGGSAEVDAGFGIPFALPLHSRFESFVFLNMCQSIGSIVISLFVARRMSMRAAKLPSPAASSIHCNKVPSDLAMGSFPALSLDLFLHYVRISLCFSLASPFGYYSLKHIGYVTMSLGKSCKLLPLVLMSVFVRKQRIDRSKLLSLLLITAGVTGFMLFGDKEKSMLGKGPGVPGSVSGVPLRSSLDGSLHAEESVMRSGSARTHVGDTKETTNEDLSSIYEMMLDLVAHVRTNRAFSGSVFGIALLLINLFLDGAMNTWQDEVFHKYRVSAFHMMLHLNWISVVMMLLFLSSPFSHELGPALQFILRYPSFLMDLVLFSLCGASGQAFVFYTIENYGAISLVTVTVTRKLFTILLSVAYFGHQLNRYQWSSVALVFAALAMESFVNRHRKSRLILVASSSTGMQTTSASSHSLDAGERAALKRD